MRCDGADVDEVEFINVGFDAYPALIGKRVDIAWIFMGWDGVQAEIMGYELNMVPLYGSCIPDYYTPVIVAGEKTIEERPDTVRRFMAATTRGYEHAIANPDEAAEILLKHSPESSPELVRRSQAWLGPRLRDDAPRWGEQKLEIWRDYALWMYERGLLAEAVEPEEAFTNAFLPE
jgi:ABC-type nitrate/sulfonate/bicarbonate transport system substrate-binding protein